MPFARFHVVDANEEAKTCWEQGIISTPALLFYWQGRPLNVRRAGWNDDNKFVGALSHEQLVELVRSARAAVSSNNALMHVDF